MAPALPAQLLYFAEKKLRFDCGRRADKLLRSNSTCEASFPCGERALTEVGILKHLNLSQFYVSFELLMSHF